MTQQTINIGSGELQGDGESIRSAFNKVNLNFTDIYNTSYTGDILFTGTYMYSNAGLHITNQGTDTGATALITLPADGGDNLNILNNYGTVTVVAAASPSSQKTWTFNTSGSLSTPGSIIPNANLSYDLGSSTNQWRSLYVGTSTIYIGGVPLTINTLTNTLIVGTSSYVSSTTTNLATESYVIDYVTQHGGADLGNLKISGSTLGTKDNPDTGGWGDYDLYLEPEGSGSNTLVYIPGLGGGNALQVMNTRDASSIVQLFGRGGVQVVTNTGATEKVFEFADNGTLIFPDGSVQSTASTGLGDFTIVGATLESDATTIKSLDGDLFLDADSDIIAKVRENGFLRIQELDDESQAFVISPTTGTITFPDGTEQTTAYTGGSSSSLVNGAYTATLESYGALSVPGTIYNRDPSNVGQLLLGGDTGEPDTYLVLPSNVGSTSMNVRLGNLNGNIQLNAGNNGWIFNNGGDIELPRGGLITENLIVHELWGSTTTSLTLIPAGAAPGSTQQLEIYGTAGGEGNHIHITSGDQNQTDLYLGNDTQYVAVGYMGQIDVRARPGTDSPSPGTSAYAGSPVWIYAGDAGDNGGDQADGALGGDILLQAGISSIGPVGLGGSVYLQSGSGISGYGSIKLSTDNGSTYLEFDKDDRLIFPNGSTSTGHTVYVPYATSSSYRITTEIEDVPGVSYIPQTFEVSGALITLPSGNGYIRSGSDGGIWNLDSTNKYFKFPNVSRINYGDGEFLSTGTIEVDVRQGGIFLITLNDSAKTWIFDNNGDLTFSSGSGIVFDSSATSTITGITNIVFANGTTQTTAWVGGGSSISNTTLTTINDVNTGDFQNTGSIAITYTAFNGDPGVNFDISYQSPLSTATGISVLGVGFTDGSVQTTAFTGTSALLDITNTNGIDTNYYITFVENRDNGQIVRADVDLTFNSWSNTLGVGNVTTGVLKIEDGAHEKFQTKTDATGVVTHDCSSGHIFYHTSPDANWTANFTNLNLDSGYATAVTLMIVQGGTGYYPSTVQIGGVAQTLNWQGNATPTPSTNRTDVVTFSIINNSGTYIVLGQLTGF